MVRKKWYSGREGWGKREINFLLSVEHNSCSAICGLRNKIKLCPPFLQEAEGSTVVTMLAMWSCGSEKSMISLIFTLCHVSVYGFSQPWRTPILCVYLEVAWLSCHMTSFFLTSPLRWLTGKSNPGCVRIWSLSVCSQSIAIQTFLFYLSKSTHHPKQHSIRFFSSFPTNLSWDPTANPLRFFQAMS